MQLYTQYFPYGGYRGGALRSPFIMAISTYGLHAHKGVACIEGMTSRLTKFALSVSEILLLLHVTATLVPSATIVTATASSWPINSRQKCRLNSSLYCGTRMLV